MGLAPHLAAQRRWRDATHDDLGVRVDSAYGPLETGTTAADMLWTIIGGYDDEDLVLGLAAWIAEDLNALATRLEAIPGMGRYGEQAVRCERKATVLVEMMRQQRAALAPMLERATGGAR
jgi:hypothetical protein